MQQKGEWVLEHHALPQFAVPPHSGVKKSINALYEYLTATRHKQSVTDDDGLRRNS